MWETNCGASLVSDLGLGPDGTVIVNSSQGLVFALRGDTGEIRWRHPLPTHHFGHPAFHASGIVFIQTSGGELRALNLADGSIRWKLACVFPDFPVSPVISASDELLVCSDNKLLALEAISGRPRWSFDAPVLETPFIAADGGIHCRTESHLETQSHEPGCSGRSMRGTHIINLHRLEAVAGRVSNSSAFSFGGGNGRDIGPMPGPLVDRDGVAYVSCLEFLRTGSPLLAIDLRKQQKLWEIELPLQLRSRPVFAASGHLLMNLYFDWEAHYGAGMGYRGPTWDEGNVVLSVDRHSGAIRWKYYIQSDEFGSPAVCPDGTILILGDDGLAPNCKATTLVALREM